VSAADRRGAWRPRTVLGTAEPRPLTTKSAYNRLADQRA